MTGMKEGAGENPFATEDEHRDSDTSADSEPTSTPQSNRGGSEQATTATENASAGRRSMQIPYKFRRDGVKDGRNRVPLFLHEETKRDERDALRQIEGRFGENVSLTDLREALVKAGLENLDAVEVTLEEWGYGMTFEE